MGLFTVKQPRGFRHNYMYYDPRKEKLQKIEEKAKAAGITPKEFVDRIAGQIKDIGLRSRRYKGKICWCYQTS